MIACTCGVSSMTLPLIIPPEVHGLNCPRRLARPDPMGEAMDADVDRRCPQERVDEPAKRYDAGKARIDLIPPEFIDALGRHFAVGAEKYAEHNWRKGMSWSRCYASAMRHLLAFWGGEEIDAETGTPHVISAAWNLAALHWYGLHNTGTDDRPGFVQL